MTHDSIRHSNAEHNQETTSLLPQLTVSGYRGIWEKTLTPSVINNLCHAFGRWVQLHHGKHILIGRDGRASGQIIAELVKQKFCTMGLDITSVNVVPTPTILFAVRTLQMDGAVVITASHNPAEYNGLKFVTKDGLFPNEKEVAEIWELTKQPTQNRENILGEEHHNDNISLLHINEILHHVDERAIRDCHFRVIVDPVNSSGSRITELLLKKLGCQTTLLNGTMHGSFDRSPEPTPSNLDGLHNSMKQMNYDVGFALDPDADRLVIADEKGNVLSEEYTLAFTVQNILSLHKGPVVINLSTSNMIEDIARKFYQETYRTKVGESNVVEGICHHHAIIGGEGNGGVIYPTINMARDSLVGIALTLELMAREGKTVSQLISSFPSYHMEKHRFPIGKNLQEKLNMIKTELPDTQINEIDGLRLDWQDRSWIQIRPSNTEPIIRVIGEAKDKENFDQRLRQVLRFLL